MSAAALAPIRTAPKISGSRLATCAALFTTDVLCLCLAGLLTALARSAFHTEIEVLKICISPATLLALVASFGCFGLYPGVGVNAVEEMRRILSATIVGYLFLICLTFILGHNLNSRLSIVMAWSLAATITIVGRNIVRVALCRYSWWGVPAVIFGTGESATRIIQVLQSHPSLALRPIAILDDASRVSAIGGIPVIGPYKAANSLEVTNEIKYAIVAVPGLQGASLARFLRQNVNCFKHVLVIPDFTGVSSLWVSARDLGGLLGLEISHVLMQPMSRFIKRVFDITVAASVGVAFLPILILVYLAVRLTSAGPVFYGQDRVGRGGKTFIAWKFRTMVVDADDVLESYLAADHSMRAEWDKTQKLRRDPRITKVGRILRKTSLDELPQIWNVICGDMSLVGPRPIMLNQIDMYGEQMELYRRVDPGITGMWQISGRNHTSFQDRVRHDEYYIQNWSVWLDLYILGRTVKTVLFTEGAY